MPKEWKLGSKAVEIGDIDIPLAEKLCNRFGYFFSMDDEIVPWYVYKKKRFLFIPYKKKEKAEDGGEIRFWQKDVAVTYIYNYLFTPVD